MTKVKENISLLNLSNYKIGGPARFLFVAKTEQDISAGIKLAKAKRQKIFILGGGTNLLISDKGFPGFVIKPDLDFRSKKGEKINIGAGTSISDLLNFTVKNKLSGFEWAGGLPGTVGGAIYGNAGAFAGEIKDSVELVRSFNIKTEKFVERDKEECNFEYRSSIFKKKRGEEIIVSAVFKLALGSHEKIKTAILEKIKHREERQPLEYPNVGSIFKNVDVRKFPKGKLGEVAHVVKKDPFPVIPTAYLIAEAGLKGISFGGAMISPKHPNFIVNAENATANDVLALISLVKSEVKRKFGVILEEEVQMVS
ncbi:MAG: UDP-N-acetylmuramate dehydrogenase [Parcubacteria group bacterium Gr01-1014_20]|nr:MAG: UDP-N-acetylmuramate dehydrogenase [Parcubacteria group bacterium Gr01-1014_20]